MHISNEDDSHVGASHALPADSLETPIEDLEASVSVGESSINGTFTPASSNVDGVSQNESAEPHISTATTPPDAHQTPEQADLRPAEIQIQPDMSVVRLIQEADHSAGKLVNLLAKHFPCFRDEGRFDGRKVRFLKRAQIFVADLWAAFDGTNYGEFYDIGHITMFAGKFLPCATKHCTSGNSDTMSLDYRVPQMLHNLGVITFSPPLESRLRRMEELKTGDSWELQLRGCSIWAVEAIRQQIVRKHPEAEAEVNAVLLDFLLYDLAKEFESTGTFPACGAIPCSLPLYRLHFAGQSTVRKLGFTNNSNERLRV